MWLSSQAFDFPTIGSSLFIYLLLLLFYEQKRVRGGGRPTWQFYLGVTTVALYRLGL